MPKRIASGSLYKPKWKDKDGNVCESEDWWARWYVPGERGKPRRVSTQTANRQEAERFLRGKMALMARDASDATIADLLALVSDDYLETGKRSKQDVDAKISAHLEPAFGKLRPGQLTSAHLKSYRDKRRGAGMANATINRELAVLRRAYNIGRAQTPPLCGEPPAFPMLREDNIRTGTLAPEKYDDLRNAFTYWLPRLAFVVGYFSGARLGEVLDIRWSNVDFKSGRILLGRTKNGEPRYLTICGEMGAYMEMAKAERDQKHPKCDYVFHIDGLPVESIKRAWKTACRIAGVPTLRFHDLRRTALTTMEMAGISRSVATAISGHKTESVYRRYHIVKPEAINDAGAKITDIHNAQQAEIRAKAKPQLKN